MASRRSDAGRERRRPDELRLDLPHAHEQYNSFVEGRITCYPLYQNAICMLKPSEKRASRLHVRLAPRPKGVGRNGMCEVAGVIFFAPCNTAVAAGGTYVDPDEPG